MKTINYSIQELLGVGFTLVVLGIGIGYGLDVMSDVRDDFVTGLDGCNATDQTACDLNYHAVNDGVTGVAKITEKTETIAVIVVASVVIGILVTYLWARFAR